MDNFSVFIDQTVGVWQIIKYVLMFGALVYLVVMGVSWDRRLLGGLALSALVFLLAGCSINEAPRTTQADAMIAQSAANTTAQQAQAAAQQQQALLASQQQAQQLNALQVAAEQAQIARSDAQAQQAQADAQQAAVMAGAIVALDNANERAAARSTWLGWLLVAIVAGGLVIGGMAVYWRGRVAVASAKVQPVQRPQLTDTQLLDIARAAGYLVERTPGGWQVIDTVSNKLVSRQQLLEVAK